MTETTEAQRQVYRARDAAHRAIIDTGRQAGAELVDRQRIRGDPAFGAERDLSPINGLKTARDTELAALYHFRGYVRQAREDGHTWRAIGEALNLGESARERDTTVAEAAFDLAAGDPNSHYALTYGRSVTWTCECNGLVIDHGPGDEERGHQAGCQRAAREEAEREREWEREP
jgi:hypothetical protein